MVMLFFLKKANFNQVTINEIIAALEPINQRPLKMYYQQTAVENYRTYSD